MKIVRLSLLAIVSSLGTLAYAAGEITPPTPPLPVNHELHCHVSPLKSGRAIKLASTLERRLIGGGDGSLSMILQTLSQAKPTLDDLKTKAIAGGVARGTMDNLQKDYEKLLNDMKVLSSQNDGKGYGMLTELGYVLRNLEAWVALQYLDPCEKVDPVIIDALPEVIDRTVKLFNLDLATRPDFGGFNVVVAKKAKKDYERAVELNTNLSKKCEEYASVIKGKLAEVKEVLRRLNDASNQAMTPEGQKVGSLMNTIKLYEQSQKTLLQDVATLRGEVDKVLELLSALKLMK